MNEKTSAEIGFESHFGVCPVSHEYDGWVNAVISHVSYCKEHKRAGM
jgi:hypothetical protein